MISIDEMEEMLNEIATTFPQDFYTDLNGGIILLPETKLHNKSEGNDLYILGEYNRDKNLGRFIAIYYGSFSQVCGYYSKEQLFEQLKSTIKHEFTHHLESLAGERGLEIKDAQDIAKYLDDKAKQVR